MMTRQTASNPYLSDFLEANRDRYHFSFEKRIPLVRKYAWAVPTEEALGAITALNVPIVEIGAGNGYWGHLLRQRGVVCHLYDSHPPHVASNDYFETGAWTDVAVGGPEAVGNHPDAALFLCWPPYAEPMAARCVELFQGEILTYVGEPPGGCTDDDVFHKKLEDEFEASVSIALPTFLWIHDSLTIYHRKKA